MASAGRSPEPEPRDLEHRVARNTPRLLLVLVVAGVAASVGLRAARSSDSSVIAGFVRPVLAATQAFVWIWVAVLLAVLACAAASLLLRRLFGDVSTAVRYRFIALLIVAAVLAFVLYVPLCLGSLSEGTYECVTVWRRVAKLVGGG